MKLMDPKSTDDLTILSGFIYQATIWSGAGLNLLGLALLTLSKNKNWDSHTMVNGYPSFYPRIALVAPSPDVTKSACSHQFASIARFKNDLRAIFN